jgi:hypothetical protein
LQQQKKKNGVQLHILGENDGNKEANVLQEYPVVGSFGLMILLLYSS